MSNTYATPRDDYDRCDRACFHDLARGVLVSDLLREDGPYGESPSVSQILLPRTLHHVSDHIAAA